MEMKAQTCSREECGMEYVDSVKTQSLRNANQLAYDNRKQGIFNFGFQSFVISPLECLECICEKNWTINNVGCCNCPNVTVFFSLLLFLIGINEND